MPFFIDTHCHLLAGLDDGPRTSEEALEMCHIAWEDGIRMVAATAHVSEQWPEVDADRIRAATRALANSLQKHRVSLSIRPAAEVMIVPGLEELWDQGRLLGIADRKEYPLTEFPGGTFWDFLPMVKELVSRGVRPILAHPERHPELLHDRPAIERLITAGCLIQVAADSIAEPMTSKDERSMRRWVRDGVVHLVGSDAHSPRHRSPRIANAYRRIVAWAGAGMADRLCSLNGLMILEGLPLQVPKFNSGRRRWFSRLWHRASSSLSSSK